MVSLWFDMVSYSRFFRPIAANLSLFKPHLVRDMEVFSPDSCEGHPKQRIPSLVLIQQSDHRMRCIGNTRNGSNTE